MLCSRQQAVYVMTIAHKLYDNLDGNGQEDKQV